MTIRASTKIKVDNLPEYVSVGDDTYLIERYESNNYFGALLKVNMTPRKRASDADFVRGNNLTELRQAILNWRYQDEHRQEVARRKAGTSDTPPVYAICHNEKVLVRGVNNHTGEMLITYLETGRKASVRNSWLLPADTDLTKLIKLKAEYDKLRKQYDALEISYRAVQDKLREIELVITYRDETDDFDSEYDGFTATGPSAYAVQEEIERQYYIREIPWFIDDNFKAVHANKGGEKFTMFVDCFTTRDKADRALAIHRQMEELEAEIDEVSGKFNYDTELEKAIAALDRAEGVRS